MMTSKIAVLALAGSLSMAATARGQEMRVIASGAVTDALAAVVPAFERETFQKVVIVPGTSVGTGPDAIPTRLQRGEAVDVIITTKAALEALFEEGKIVPGSGADLVRSRIGMVVRRGAPKPDISSVEALTRTLRQAKSVAYSASLSGVYLSSELFPRLGVADEVGTKSKGVAGERVAAVVARGEAEIGFQQISELLPVPGIDFVGPLPAEVQQVTIFSAGAATVSKDHDMARSLVRFLATRAAAGDFIKHGLDPARPPQ